MSIKRTFSTSLRVLTQLTHDKRTVGLIFIVPNVLLVMLNYLFEDNFMLFNAIAPLILGIIPFTLMFIITSVAMMRERTSGTLDRLLVSPASRLDIILGYAGTFAFMAFLQALILSSVAIYALDVDIAGSTSSLLLITVLAGVVGMSFGLFFSTFAQNEFQAVQFMPAFVLPQFLTSGIFTPRENMADFLQTFSDLMPITYIVEAMGEVSRFDYYTDDLQFYIWITTAFILGSLFLGSLTLKSN